MTKSVCRTMTSRGRASCIAILAVLLTLALGPIQLVAAEKVLYIDKKTKVPVSRIAVVYAGVPAHWHEQLAPIHQSITAHLKSLGYEVEDLTRSVHFTGTSSQLRRDSASVVPELITSVDRRETAFLSYGVYTRSAASPDQPIGGRQVDGRTYTAIDTYVTMVAEINLYLTEQKPKNLWRGRAEWAYEHESSRDQHNDLRNLADSLRTFTMLNDILAEGVSTTFKKLPKAATAAVGERSTQNQRD